MTTKTWGAMPAPTAGAWADHVEQEEENGGVLGPDTQEFPSLGEAAKVPVKKEKKKSTKLSLSEFIGGRDSSILSQLPTAPRERSEDERTARREGGGAFKDYGDRGDRGDRFDRRSGERRDDAASRADQVSNWGSERKFTPSDPREGRSFGGGFGGGREYGRERDERRGSREREAASSAADESDDWKMNKKFEPGAFPEREGREGRGGFGDRPRPEYRSSKADEEETWGRGRTFDSSEPQRRGYANSRERESRPADGADRWNRKDDVPAEPAGSSQRPRLQLQPRTKPLEPATNDKAEDSEKASEQPKKNNPFGAARPREEVLREKGVDPLKEDLKLEHGDVAREPTPQEQELKNSIEKLRCELEVLQTNDSVAAEELDDIRHQIDEKEKAFLLLQAEEDSKLKYARDPRKPERERPQGRSASKDKW